MELWTQARPFSITRRSLRHGTRDDGGAWTAVERLLKTCITSAYVRNQDPLGTTSFRINGRARLSLGGDRMDGLAPCFPAATRTRLVHGRALADLSAARILYLVVQVRRLCTED